MLLEKLSFIDAPFKRVAVDRVCPVESLSDINIRLLLFMIDYATFYHRTMTSAADGKTNPAELYLLDFTTCLILATIF